MLLVFLLWMRMRRQMELLMGSPPHLTALLAAAGKWIAAAAVVVVIVVLQLRPPLLPPAGDLGFRTGIEPMAVHRVSLAGPVAVVGSAFRDANSRWN